MFVEGGRLCHGTMASTSLNVLGGDAFLYGAGTPNTKGTGPQRSKNIEVMKLREENFYRVDGVFGRKSQIIAPTRVFNVPTDGVIFGIVHIGAPWPLRNFLTCALRCTMAQWPVRACLTVYLSVCGLRAARPRQMNYSHGLSRGRLKHVVVSRRVSIIYPSPS